MLADALAARWRLPGFKSAGVALVTGGVVRGADVILVKPQTYMNRSGQAIQPLLRRGLVPASELLVLSDDFALPLGAFRLRARGSAGGHHGLESVEGALGSRDYARLRIGTGPVPDDVDDRADWVLAPMSPPEGEALAALLPVMGDAVECWIAEGIETAMNRYNRRGIESD